MAISDPKVDIYSSIIYWLEIIIAPRMKQLFLTFLAIFIILGQQGSFEHAYHDHDHDMGEVCDYCLSGKSLDHLAINSLQSIAPTFDLQWKNAFVLPVIYKSHTSYFAARAPPRFI